MPVKNKNNKQKKIDEYKRKYLKILISLIFLIIIIDLSTVYFYFNNLKPEYRNFKSLKDYKKQRNAFIEGYTLYVNSCK